MVEPLLASGGLMDDLGINPAVLLTQVVIFSVTFLALSRILFGRVLSNLQRREEETREGHAAVGRDRAELDRLAKEYEAAIAKVDKESYDRTQAMLKEALATASAGVAQAQAQARSEVENALARIAREKQEASSRVRADIARLTLEVAEKAMETRLDPATHGAMVQKFLAERS